MVNAARPKLKYHNRTKVFLCYALAWGIALLLPYAGLLYLYPYKLAGTAPDITVTLSALPFLLPDSIRHVVTSSSLTAGIQGGALYSALAAREMTWRAVVATLVATGWAVGLLWQLLWRVTYRHPRQAARATLHAVHSYRWSMFGIWLVNALLALGLYTVGVRLIPNRTAWDYILYFNGFILPPLAAWVCFRLAAPPAISGKHAFFKRL